MKRFFTLLAFFSVLSVSLYAQPTVMMPEDIYPAGESICVPVNVKDFTDITTMNFSVTWDTAVIQFTNIQVQDPVFNNNDYFDTSQAAAGVLAVTFSSPTPLGSTIIDNNQLVTAFELCFEIVSPCGTFSTIEIGAVPQPILVTRANTGTTNIGMLAMDGLVSVCVSTLIINTTSASGDVGDEVCIDFSVENFTNMLVMQYTISWDPTVMEFASVGNFNLEGLAAANFGTASQENLDNGDLTLLWQTDDFNAGNSLPDMSTIFQVCFDLIGDAGSVTEIGLTDSPTPIQAGKIDYDEDIGLIHNDGRVFINSVDGTSVLASQESVLPAEDTCLHVTVRDFIDMNSMVFNMAWDPSIISFTEVVSTGILPGVIFNEANTGTGMLGAEWMTLSTPVTLNNNAVIFDVCFSAVGDLTEISPFDFSNVTFVNDENEAFSNGVSGSIEIIAKDLILSASDDGNIPNEAVCVEFSVENFDDIFDLEFSANWETAVMTLDSIGAFNLPGLDDSNFDVDISDFGTLTMVWDDASNTGISLAPGSIIFKAYFTIVEDAEVGDCSLVTFDGLTTEPGASTVDIDGEPYPLNVQTNNGEVCVLDPNGYSIRIPNRAVNPDEEVCVDFVVSDFDDIVNTQFSIQWDNTVLEYTEVTGLNNLPNLSTANFGDTDAANGTLTFGWTSDDVENGTTVATNTTIFRVCFMAIGESLECTDINITGTPNPIEVMTAQSEGNNLLLDIEDGEVCINDGIAIVDTIITHLGCEGVMNGSIQLVVEGGEGPYEFLWSAGDNPNQNPVTGLGEGMVNVTILDQTGLSLEASYEIMVLGEAPVAEAGDDVLLGCGSDIGVLDASASTTGDDIIYTWSSPDGGLIIENETTTSPTVQGAATYILTVSNSVTTCSSEDMVEVLAGIPLPISAGQDQEIQCASDTATLSGNDLGEGYEYLWTAEDGGMISSDATQIEIQATAEGTYILEVMDLEANCSAFDTAFVVLGDNQLMANAGEDDMIPCSDPNFLLQGSATPAGNYDYVWVSNGTGNIASGDSTSSPIVNMPGTYTLTVTNPQNGCFAEDEVVITEEPNGLMANAGSGGLITCTVDTLTLGDATASTGTNITYQWVGIDGGSLAAGEFNELNPRVLSGGTYIFVVRDTMTGCERRDEVIVATDTISPMVEAGEETILPCDQDDVQLDASGTDEGAMFSYVWSPEALIDDTDPLMPIASQPGLYELMVTNETNGCTATDVVNVEADDSAPPVIIETPDAFGCNGTELVQLDASGSTTAAGDTYEWFVISGEGAVIDTDDPLMPNVTAGGTYQLVITNAAGCPGTGDVEVIDNSVEVSAFASVIGGLSCNRPEVTLEGNGSSMGDVTYQWTNLDTGIAPTDGDQMNATAIEGGNYELMVTHTESGCSAQDTVNVFANFTAPMVDVMSTSDLIFNCPDTTIQLQGSLTVDDPDVNTSFVWNVFDGGSLGSSPNDLLITTLTPGTYQLVGTVFESGCQDSIEIVLEEFMSTVEINITNPLDSTTCLQNTITIDASGSTLNEDVIIQWDVNGLGEIVSGANTLTPVVTGNTIYTLTLTDPTNECEESQEVIVLDSGDRPDIVVEALGAIDCDNAQVTIDGTGSSDGEGFEFAWNPLGNGNIVSGANTLTPQVNVGGLYELVVTNTGTGCIASDTVQVEALVDLPVINAGADDSTCGDMFTLSASLPDTASGTWTTLDGTAIVMNPEAGTTEVTDLSSGQNSFVWTQSVPSCPDYATDTVTIISAPQPIANNDAEEVNVDNNPITFNVISNDVLENIENWTVELISQPTTGTITRFENGVIDYKATGNFSGTEEFSYILCSDDCPDQCDTALVRLFIEKDPNFIDSTLIDIPNAITPNGDGMNDAFVFDVIENNPEKYPDSELVVFNRWGDIVYKSQPYLNNWEGTNDSGNPLPHGTYYYILRLSIFEGEVIRGDVTILK